MNYQIIKFVAGAGKTTYSLNYMTRHKNGLYLAFNNKVVNDISIRGLLSKTIDSFFQTYIIPKFISLIPIIGENKKIVFKETSNPALQGVTNIHVDEEGNIYSKKKKTEITLNDTNEYLHSRDYFPNSNNLKYIFSKTEVRITNALRSEISMYLIKKYPMKIIELIESRFSFIIIDEAQDLNGYREEFGKLLEISKIPLIVLGDDNQNINGGGKWFEELIPTETKNISSRCPEINCKWIREHLGIEIYGNSNVSEFHVIDVDDISAYNNTETALLYIKEGPWNKEILESWKGPVETIKSAKGSTINKDVVICAKTLNDKFLYTAITRTTKSVYSPIKK